MSRPAPPTVAAALSVDEAARLRLAILRIARTIRQRATSGITPSQLSVLVTVERHGPLTLGEVAGREQVRPPSASRIVAALEADGLVVRHTDPNDRRVSVVEVSPAGRDLVAEHRVRGRTWIVDQVEGLDADEVDHIRRALPALERLVEARP